MKDVWQVFLVNPDLLRWQESELHRVRADPILGKFFNWPKYVEACFNCLSENMSQSTLMITCGYKVSAWNGLGSGDAVKCKFLNQPLNKYPSSPAEVDVLFQNYFRLFLDWTEWPHLVPAGIFSQKTIKEFYIFR